MKTIQTEVLVIGGGATGTGVIRDLAMRGFKSILVERGDLATGTTGRYHGLLHSGGRYVVKDPQAARECIEENNILRRIMPQCIEDTSGFFVVTPWDGPEYAPMFVDGCQKAGIPVEEVTINQMLREEPLLNPKISRCFRVPDAAADSWLAADLNASSAQEYGSTILRYHKVIRLLREGNRVVGAACHDLVDDQEVSILADCVVNASGAWAGQIAASIEVPVNIVPGKGVMLAANHRILHTVVNRCKMPSDGDILVPIHTVTVIGTTDVKVSDPDHFAIQPWEVRLMLEEGEKLVPGFKGMRMLRAWGGVRPLYQETVVSDTRDITRAYVLLDHEQRDGISGLVTITSGKWTTYRRMAEVTVDLVCSKLGVDRPCRTHLEALPDAKRHGFHVVGSRLANVERDGEYGRLVCECELATYEDVLHAIEQGQAKTIDDVRRDIRLGMGPCQGAFCTYRIAGMLHDLRRPPVEKTNVALRDFLQERWKGLLPIMWGQQARQERLNELIYVSLLNAEALPGPTASRLAPHLYMPAEPEKPGEHPAGETAKEKTQPARAVFTKRAFSTATPGVDVLVIGAGLAGLVCAWQASLQGARVRLISKGWGAAYWHTGCVDVWGPDGSSEIENASSMLAEMVALNPQHPYAIAGLELLEQAIKAFQGLCETSGYPLHGSLQSGWLLPTALGTLRKTCLAPETMLAGDVRQSGTMAMVGFEPYLDFYPHLAADNLMVSGVPAKAITLQLDSLKERKFVTARFLAQQFESPAFRDEVVQELLKNPDISSVDRFGFPAVLGLMDVLEIKQDLEQKLGRPVFEIPTLPPSVPGMRLHKILTSEIEKNGGRVLDGMQVLSAELQEDTVLGIWSEAAARHKLQRAGSYVLATGGILGGGFVRGSDGSLRESIFNLPLAGNIPEPETYRRSFLGSGGQPVHRAGILVNRDLQPLDSQGNRLYRNLYAVGTALAEADPIQERSLEGIALVSGFAVGRRGMNR